MEVSGHSRLSVVRSFPAKGNERSSTFLLQIREQKMRAEGGSLEDPEEGKFSPASSSPYSAGSLPGFIPVII